jgi:hypothetical protein
VTSSLLCECNWLFHSGTDLGDIEDLYEVNEYDVCLGCCPHGRGSGFIGLRSISLSTTADLVAPSPMKRGAGPSSGRPVDSPSSLRASGGPLSAPPRAEPNAHLRFIPRSAVDDWANSSNADSEGYSSANIVICWRKLKAVAAGLFASSSPEIEVGAVQPTARSGSRDQLRQLTNANNLFGDSTAAAASRNNSATELAALAREGRPHSSSYGSFDNLPRSSRASPTYSRSGKGSPSLTAVLESSNPPTAASSLIMEGGNYLRSQDDESADLRYQKLEPPAIKVSRADVPDSRHKYSKRLRNADFQYDDNLQV